MAQQIFLESDRLVYKPLSIHHCSDRYVGWLNDPNVNRYLETASGYDLDQLNIYLDAIEKNEHILFWAIHMKENDLHIGNIKIDPVNTKNNIGEYGIMIGDSGKWGSGYAKEASITIIEYCFNVINLRKMTLGVVEENYSAVRLYESLGFVIEGRLVRHGKYEGNYHNILRMALFNSNFTE